jgi:hypothetical protein
MIKGGQEMRKEAKSATDAVYSEIPHTLNSTQK